MIGEEERRAFLSSSPHSVVHLDLSESSGEHDRYERAAHLLERWRTEGALRGSAAPCYYAYEMRFRLHARERRIRGLFCALELEDWGGGVLPHERTMSGPVEDRLRLLRATRTNISAVYGTVAGPVPALGVPPRRGDGAGAARLGGGRRGGDPSRCGPWRPIPRSPGGSTGSPC